jgi:chemotaxis response regulator CheB
LVQSRLEPPPGLVPASEDPDRLKRVVALHLSPDFVSRVADILGRHTALRVKEAQQGDRLRAGWACVAPPGSHLLARADGTVSLTLTEKVHDCRPWTFCSHPSRPASDRARSEWC